MNLNPLNFLYLPLLIFSFKNCNKTEYWLWCKTVCHNVVQQYYLNQLYFEKGTFSMVSNWRFVFFLMSFPQALFVKVRHTHSLYSGDLSNAFLGTLIYSVFYVNSKLRILAPIKAIKKILSQKKVSISLLFSKINI